LWAVTLVLISGCQSGAELSFTPPPADIGDTVIVPPELQAEYDRLVASQAHPSLPANLEQMTLIERRALGMYIVATSLDIDVIHLTLITSLDRKERATNTAFQLIDQLGMLHIIEGTEIGTVNRQKDWWIGLWFDGRKSRGEIAWYGDWVLRNYPEDFLIYNEGQVISLAGT